MTDNRTPWDRGYDAAFSGKVPINPYPRASAAATEWSRGLTAGQDCQRMPGASARDRQFKDWMADRMAETRWREVFDHLYPED